MITDTRAYLDRLFADANLVELRHQTNKSWVSTWHPDSDSLLAEARHRSNVGNLFTSLNHVSEPPHHPIRNEDVDRYCRLLFDFDPVRPTDTASSADELQEARDRAIGLQRHLSGHGWPIPGIAVSGNGYHLQYRTALPNTAEVREQLTAIYAGLHRRFDDDVVHFDRAVRNPGRICALYGSVKRKGESTAERPHRQSFVQIPHDYQQAHPRMIERLANTYAKEVRPQPLLTPSASRGTAFIRGSGDYVTLDVVALFQVHGAYVRHITGNVHSVRCPWSNQHTTPSPSDGGDTVIFEPNQSWPGFHCKHSHCADRTIRDVIALWRDADQYCRRTFGKTTGEISARGVSGV